MQTPIHRDSKPWQVQVWASFLIAVFSCAVGLSYLPGRDLDWVFMMMGYFFCVLAAFVRAKYVLANETGQTDGNDTPMSQRAPMTPAGRLPAVVKLWSASSFFHSSITRRSS